MDCINDDSAIKAAARRVDSHRVAFLLDGPSCRDSTPGPKRYPKLSGIDEHADRAMLLCRPQTLEESGFPR
jgi:hypothetical protein